MKSAGRPKNHINLKKSPAQILFSARAALTEK